MSGNKIREDLWFFRVILEKGHVDFQSVARINEIDSMIKAIGNKYGLSGAYQHEFYLDLLKTNSLVNDIHTAIYLASENNEYSKKRGKFLPLSLSYEAGRLLVRDISFEGNKKLKGRQIVSINGISADSLMNVLVSFVNIDGNDPLVQKKLAAYYFRSLFPILFTLRDSNLIVLKKDTSDLNDTIILPAELKKRTTSKNLQSEKPENFSFSYLNNENVGYLRISSFLPSGLLSYRIFLRDVFQFLRKNKTEVLILDLRYNGGGLLDYAKELLKYLMPFERKYIDYITVRNNIVMQWVLIKNSFLQPEITRFIGRISGKAQSHLWSKNSESIYKNFSTKSVKPDPLCYSGKLYVLFNSFCASATGIVLNNIYMRPNTIFFGTPAACTRNGSYGNPVSFTLPNSRIQMTVSNIYIKQTVDTTFLNLKSYPYQNIAPHIFVEDMEFPQKTKDLYFFLRDKEQEHMGYKNDQ